MVQLLDHGAQDFIVKPFSERELLVRVRNLVLAQQAREQMNGFREAAESANRAKDEFLAMLGHELRNPLSPILTALQLMKLRGEPGSERERTVIERQVSHLTRLVDDLLDVSRIARGKVELKTEIVEMAEVVAKAIEMASPLLEQRTHTLTVDVPRRGLRVDGDPTRLSQVVSNLLTNAAKYTPPNGVDRRFARRASTTTCVLSVRDTGIGIAAEMLPRIFDLFVQERQALDRSQGGLGLGLTIVRSLVERHGGSVSAHSDGPGKGSEFIVRCRLEGRDARQRGATRGAGSRQRRRVARPPGTRASSIVDDNEDGASCWPRRSTGKGYDTRVAHDAPTALRVAAEFAPDVAFLDIGLPVMDGYELAAHLRQLPGLAEPAADRGDRLRPGVRPPPDARRRASTSTWSSPSTSPHSRRRCCVVPTRSIERHAPRPSASRRRGGELAALRREEQREQPRRAGRAGVARHGVELSRRLHEHLALAIGPLGAVIDLRDNLTLEHVGEGQPGMAMRGRAAARCIRDLDDGHRPAVEREVRQIVLEDRFRWAGTALRLRGAGEQQQACGFDQRSTRDRASRSGAESDTASPPGLTSHHRCLPAGNLVACHGHFSSASRAGHPVWRRCSSLKYCRYSHSSRLASRAPRSEIHYWNDRYRPLVGPPDRPRRCAREMVATIGRPTNGACPTNWIHHRTVTLGGRCVSTGMTTKDMIVQTSGP